MADIKSEASTILPQSLPGPQGHYLELFLTILLTCSPIWTSILYCQIRNITSKASRNCFHNFPMVLFFKPILLGFDKAQGVKFRVARVNH
jgi:hypothetical protein